MLNTEAFRQVATIMGERIVVYKAIPHGCSYPPEAWDQGRGCPDCERGFLYETQPVSRGLVAEQRIRLLTAETGFVSTGRLMLTTIPDETLLGAFDKVQLLDRTLLARERMKRGEDTFPHPGVVHVNSVTQNAAAFIAGVDYAVVGNGLVWLTRPSIVERGVLRRALPATADERFMVARGTPNREVTQNGAADVYAIEYTYAPVFWYVADESRPPRPVPMLALSGLTMPQTPQRGQLVTAPPPF